MAKEQGKKRLIVTVIVLGLVLLIAGFIVLQNINKPTTVETTTVPPVTSTEADTPAEPTLEKPTDTSTTPDVDESTLTSIDIEPLAIAVYYTKGVPGFEYSVERTSDKTQYVQFTSPELVGTKCTDDKGDFASIVKNPTSAEDKTTLKATRTIGGNTYGLSLAGDNCTKDTDLLKEYQTAFTNGFSRLKEL